MDLAATCSLVGRGMGMEVYLLLTLLALIFGIPGAVLSALLLKDRWKRKEGKPH
jgi:hypothetical protein